MTAIPFFFLRHKRKTMKSFATVLAVALVAASAPGAAAFSGSSFSGSQLNTAVRNSGAITMEYIPS
jgi:hypothetical protein